MIDFPGAVAKEEIAVHSSSSGITHGYACDKCKNLVYPQDKYCPACGAKFTEDGEKKGGTKNEQS
jgi:uncharacterized OB-fold protein